MVLACFGTFLRLCTANAEFGLPFWQGFATLTGIPPSYCKYRMLSSFKSDCLLRSYDINDELGGTSFKTRHKNWPKDPLVEDFSNWTAESFSRCRFFSGGKVLTYALTEVKRNSGEVDGKKNDTCPNIKLPMDEQGYPILPSWEVIKGEGLTYKKSLIGKFMSEMYRE
jgi:hypothetical protein